MSENDLDGGQSAGTASQPSGVGSQGKGDSDGSFDATKLQSTLENVLNRVNEIDKAYKTFQSGKDRGANKTGEEVAELKRKIAEIEKLKKSGLDEDGAIEEHSFREDIRAVKEQLHKLIPSQGQPAGNSAPLAVEAAKVIEQYKLDANDPDVVAQVLTQTDPKDAELAALRLLQRRSSQPTPSPTAASTSVGTPARPSDVDALTKQYQNEMSAAQGNPSLARALKAEYAKKGVPVDSVVFH